MRRLLFSILGVAASVGIINAQVVVKPNFKVQPELRNIKVVNGVDMDKKLSGAKKRANGAGSTWYEYTEAIGQNTAGKDLDNFIAWLMPDTNGITISSTGTKNKVAYHALGQVFSPLDSTFQVLQANDPDIAVLTKFNPYTVDSFAWTQFYIRNIEKINGKDVVDTLFIEYFDNTGLTPNSYYYQADPKRLYYYSIPNNTKFSTSTLLNSGRKKIDTVLLTKDFGDSVAYATSSIFGRGLQTKVGMSINPNGALSPANCTWAYTMVFKPMKKPALGDTLLNFQNPKSNFKKFNIFGIRMADLNASTDLDARTPQRINNSYISNYQVRYGQTLSIWKSYISGTGFGNGLYLDNFVKISYTNASTNKTTIGSTKLKVVPNPALGSSVLVDFNAAWTGNTVVKITDMTGKVVYTSSVTVSRGNNSLEIPVSNLTKGVYTVSVSNGTYNGASQFVK